jgi:ribosome biogenesis GTPase
MGEMSIEALGWTRQRVAEFAELARRGLMPGRIVGEHRTHFEVATEHGEVAAEVPGRMWNATEIRSDMPGVGDFVALMPGEGDGPAIIDSVLPRTSALIRQAAGERRPQLIAANVDVVLIVTALDGDFNLQRIERYLAVVREGGAEPVIVINKADIAGNADAALAELAKVAPDVAVHLVSAHDPADVVLLAGYFNDRPTCNDGNAGNNGNNGRASRTIALVGSSGVGKSTLTNRLLGEDVQATQAVRAHDNRGRHTTTHRQLFQRASGGAIMDTPGMRSIELWDSEPEPELDFSDLEELAAQCKFRNCRHDHEPACAVRAAVKAGDVDADRAARFIAELG